MSFALLKTSNPGNQLANIRLEKGEEKEEEKNYTS